MRLPAWVRLVAAIVAVLTGFVLLVLYYDHWRKTAPCSEFDGDSITEIPFRCLPEGGLGR